MNTTLRKILLILSIVVFVAGYNFWHYAWHGFFYQCTAVGILLLFLVIQDLATEKWFKKIATIGVWFAVNNLLDEVFFDPTHVQWNEYLFAGIIVLVTLIKRK